MTTWQISCTSKFCRNGLALQGDYCVEAARRVNHFIGRVNCIESNIRFFSYPLFPCKNPSTCRIKEFKTSNQHQREFNIGLHGRSAFAYPYSQMEPMQMQINFLTVFSVQQCLIALQILKHVSLYLIYQQPAMHRLTLSLVHFLSRVIFSIPKEYAYSIWTDGFQTQNGRTWEEDWPIMLITRNIMIQKRTLPCISTNKFTERQPLAKEGQEAKSGQGEPINAASIFLHFVCECSHTRSVRRFPTQRLSHIRSLHNLSAIS